jgi:hypothetical protein
VADSQHELSGWELDRRDTQEGVPLGWVAAREVDAAVVREQLLGECVPLRTRLLHLRIADVVVDAEPECLGLQDHVPAVQRAAR